MVQGRDQASSTQEKKRKEGNEKSKMREGGEGSGTSGGWRNCCFFTSWLCEISGVVGAASESVQNREGKMEGNQSKKEIVRDSLDEEENEGKFQEKCESLQKK